MNASPSAPYHWPLEAIWEEVSGRLPEFSVELLPEIDSTNSELMRRSRTGSCAPVLLVAEHQTAGRGRLGRQWLAAAEPDRGAGPQAMPSLTFSLGLPLHCADWSGLSLVVGLSVAQSLKSLCPVDVAADLGLKWPNDVWWRMRKLAGILIETSGAVPAGTNEGNEASRYAVIGVGVNMQAPKFDAVAAVPGQMPSVEPVGFEQLAKGVGAGQVLKQLIWPLIQDVLRFEQLGFGAFADRYKELDVLHGQAIQLSDGRTGVARGIDGTGALWVDVGGVRQTINSGDISVRPVHSLHSGNPHSLHNTALKYEP